MGQRRMFQEKIEEAIEIGKKEIGDGIKMLRTADKVFLLTVDK